MNKILKKGQSVDVFSDPITKTEREGTATIIKIISTPEETGSVGMYRCRVKFHIDGFECNRLIDATDTI